jgi:hypothetical protein
MASPEANREGKDVRSMAEEVDALALETSGLPGLGRTAHAGANPAAPNHQRVINLMP